MVRTIKNAVAKIVYDQLGEWDRTLPEAMRGYRVRATAERPSPFELMFGVKLRIMPVEQPESAQVVSEDYCPLELAQLAVTRETLRQKGSNDAKPRFAFGDLVLMVCSQDKDRKTRKMALRWDGPYRVVDIKAPGYKLRDNERRVSRRYIYKRRLRQYFARTAQSLSVCTAPQT